LAQIVGQVQVSDRDSQSKARPSRAIRANLVTIVFGRWCGHADLRLRLGRSAGAVGLHQPRWRRQRCRTTCTCSTHRLLRRGTLHVESNFPGAAQPAAPGYSSSLCCSIAYPVFAAAPSRPLLLYLLCVYVALLQEKACPRSIFWKAAAETAHGLQ
jgi:hypothetical protein